MEYVKRELARGLDDWEQRLGTALVKSSPTDLVKAAPRVRRMPSRRRRQGAARAPQGARIGRSALVRDPLQSFPCAGSNLLPQEAVNSRRLPPRDRTIPRTDRSRKSATSPNACSAGTRTRWRGSSASQLASCCATRAATSTSAFRSPTSSTTAISPWSTPRAGSIPSATGASAPMRSGGCARAFCIGCRPGAAPEGGPSRCRCPSRLAGGGAPRRRRARVRPASGR